MSPGRRVVRATPDFFIDLDRQLPQDRTGTTPSRADFQTYELLRIVDEFAAGFDDLPEVIPGRAAYRILVVAGHVVPRISVIGQPAADNAVELVQLDLDLETDW